MKYGSKHSHPKKEPIMFDEEKIIICPTCGSKVLATTPKCPHCCTLLKKKTSPNVASILAICLFLFLIVIMCGSILLSEIKEERTFFKDTTISLYEFDRIKTGMTYSEVVEIVGVEGTLMSEVDIGFEEYATKMYSWEGNGYKGSNATVTFQNGKVVSKAQIGLE